MQSLFHYYPKPVQKEKEATRHPLDYMKDHMVYYFVHDKQRKYPRYECKGLRHDMILWGITGQPNVS